MAETAAPRFLAADLHDPDALPTPSAVTAPYFAAAARGELIFRRCDGGHAFHYPRSLCPVCHSTQLEWEQASGRGEVVSFAVVHRPPWDSLPRNTPYVVVLVLLEEGPQLLSTLEQVAPADVKIGMVVQAAFERVSDVLGLVRFVRADLPPRG